MYSNIRILITLLDLVKIMDWWNIILSINYVCMYNVYCILQYICTYIMISLGLSINIFEGP